MFRVVNNNISIIRGDSATFTLSITDANGDAYTLLDTDVVTMMVRSSPTSDAVISKTFTDATLSIAPSDTSSLATGTYVYDVQIVHSDGWTDTIIPVHQFVIMPEVTYGGGE